MVRPIIHVVLCLDDRYAMPAAAMVLSLRDRTSPRYGIHAHVLTSALSPEARAKLEESWRGRLDAVHWTAVAAEDCERHLPPGSHFSAATFAKLRIASHLPPALGKALYLDCDIIVRGDMGELWETPFAGAVACVVANHGLPFAGMMNDAFWRKFPVRKDALVFNSGVMLIDLAAWRAQGVEERLLAALRSADAKPRFADQCVLNVVLHDRVRFLPPKWNAWDRLHVYRHGLPIPHHRTEVQEALDRPAVIHFAMPSKPWHPGHRHSHRDLFFHYVDQSAWRGWRPKALSRAQRWRLAVSQGAADPYVTLARAWHCHRLGLLRGPELVAAVARVLWHEVLGRPRAWGAPLLLGFPWAWRALTRRPAHAKAG